jgi:hypothetical protein
MYECLRKFITCCHVHSCHCWNWRDLSSNWICLRPHFLFPFNNSDFPKFPRSFLLNRRVPSSQLLLFSPEIESVTVNMDVLLPPECRKSLYSSLLNATNNNRYNNMLWKLEQFCKYFVILFIMLTGVISICDQQCTDGICNKKTFLHLPRNTCSTAVFVSGDGTSSSTLEATFLCQKLPLQIFCYSIVLMPCDEFFPVKVICVVSKFGCISAVHRRTLFKAPFQLVQISAVLQNNEQLGNLTSLLQPAPVLPASHCS